MPMQQPGPPQPGIPYDFNAADNLEMTLNNVAKPLRKLLIYRGNWANQYLAYQDNGRQQGWIGTEYSRWAVQFNESQFIMGKYVNQLCGRAVDVHNTSFNIYTTSFNAGGDGITSFNDGRDAERRSYISYAAPQGWRGAHPNVTRNGTEGATPECLYSYSNNATKANDDNFRSLFAKTLTAAAAAAPAADTAWSKAGNPPASSLAKAIAWFLSNQVLELDARVRLVGQAFALAGGHLPAGGNPGFRTYSGQMGSVIQNEVLPLNQLERDAANNAMTADDWKELAKHSSDPAFNAAFFNRLTPNQLQDLLLTYTDWDGTGSPSLRSDQDHSEVLAQALADAYADGLNKSIQQTVVTWLFNDRGDRFVPAFLTALGGNPGPGLQGKPAVPGNPQAALNFIHSLSQQQFDSLASGLGAGGDTSGEWAALFVGVCATGMLAEPDKTLANQLYTQIVGRLPYMSGVDPNSLVPQFGALLASYTRWNIRPPTPGEDLTTYSEDVGKFLHSNMQTFLDFLNSRHVTDTVLNGVPQAIVTDLFFIQLTQLFDGPIGVALDLGAHFVQDVVAPVLQNTTEPAPVDPGTSKDVLQQSVGATAQITVIMQLAAQHRIYYDRQPATKDQIQNLLTEVIPPLNANDQDTVSGILSQHWTVEGGGELYPLTSTAKTLSQSR